MFTIRQLRYFQILANTGHFGEASEKLGISQPALSVQIAEMEKLAGSPLFERTSKRIILTPLGCNFLPIINDILARLSVLGDIVAAHESPLSYPIKLGIIPTVAPYILPSVLPKIRHLYPSLALQIQEAKTDRLVELLRNGHIDAIVAATPVEDGEFVSEPIFDDNFYYALPRDDPQSVYKNVREGDVDTGKLLLLEEGHCLRDQTLEACQTKKYRHDITASSLTTLMQLVANGIGITIIPQIAVSTEARLDNISVVAFEGETPQRHICLFWRRRSRRSKDFKLLADLLKSMAIPILDQARNFIV
ncbi:hydrogen peroxide-inducible genes activator [uncultured Bartonella sp.]|uniref:hydrogen peroxide-inducible genes activator n=1 Tax=uncultured Bartonella sp. TaxID=104108 RepID=UPI0025D94CB6|nr:hydrogen peroxide-inducible genes activator [uncultured Bartonella sp.]